MTLLDELDFELNPPNVFQRGMQRLGSTRPGAWAFSVLLQPIDRFLFNRTNGRVTVPGLMAGLPVIMVTTTGAKSGQARTSPLLRTGHARNPASTLVARRTGVATLSASQIA